ncbi:MAG: HlyD family secretion protein, partial [Prevotella sp.]|nr:HlyD family secretion protein [Prevotella sp.]
MKRLNIILAISIILLSSCKKTEEESIATGIFEATETTVSAEQNGKLVQFTVTEGQTLASGQEVGLVDTVPLMLKLAQLGATR